MNEKKNPMQDRSLLVGLLALVISLLSGILLGIFSATEASVVCCLYSLFLGIFIWRTLIVGKDDVAPLHAAKN